MNTRPNNITKKIMIIQLFILCWLGITVEGFTQNDEGYIYGTVTMTNGDSYTGQLRWGKEEAFWDEIFNSTKLENPHIKKLSRKDAERFKNRGSDNWNFTWLFDDDDNRRYNWGSSTHQFSTRFGDLKSIEMMGGKEVDLTFKDGSKMRVAGGSNDVSTRINVWSDEVGEISLYWDKISQIQFKQTPKKLGKKAGEPLYGTVETIHGSFTGLIQWDHEENLSIDELNGYTENGKMNIEFGNIKSLERKGNQTLVTLKSGSEFLLGKTNDVDRSNRGIVVRNSEIGKVKVSWREFEKLTFDLNNTSSGESYSSYNKPKRLEGTITTLDDKIIKGKMVFDLDEEFDYEILNATEQGVEYEIPFRLVKKIMPKNEDYSTVVLRSGKSWILGGSQDVTDRNSGVLVEKGKDEWIYVQWEDIKELVFN